MKIVIVHDKLRSMQPMMQITQKHHEQIKKILPTAQIAVVNDLTEKELEIIKDADVLIISSLLLTEAIFAKAKNLKWVHSETAGINNLPAEVIDSDVLITNSSGVHPIPIAEHVFGIMLVFERKLHISLRVQYFEKKWIRDERYFNMGELQGKTVGIVGFGKIGIKIAQLSRAFSMKVNAAVRNTDSKRLYVDRLYKNSQLKEMVRECDYIVNALPLTPETKYIFNQEIFSSMKPTAYYINIGRGQTTKEEDLITALKEGTIAGAGLDVFEEEPLSSESPLWDLENVILTPHNSGWTPYYMDRVIDIFLENLKAYLKGDKMPNLVDKKRGY